MSELPREDATPARSDAASPEQIGPGKRLGRHRVTALLGRGGMGAVFAAHDPELDREVAIKIVRADARDPQPDLHRQLHRHQPGRRHAGLAVELG